MSILECISKKLYHDCVLKEKKINFPPVTEDPSDFEKDICLIIAQGKLTNIWILIEMYKIDVETKDKDENTPINIASKNCRLYAVKYLYKTCHA